MLLMRIMLMLTGTLMLTLMLTDAVADTDKNYTDAYWATVADMLLMLMLMLIWC